MIACLFPKLTSSVQSFTLYQSMGYFRRREIYFFLFSQKTAFDISCTGDNLHEMSKPGFLEKNKENILKCRLLKSLPRVLSVKENVFPKQHPAIDPGET